MPSPLQQLLVNASRPLKQFETVIEGNAVTLYTRKPSQADSAAIQAALQARYEEVLENKKTTDISAASIQRLGVDKLIDYIARADRNDLQADARMMIPDATSNDDPRVVEKLDELVEERKKELTGKSHDELLSLAMERRDHIAALLEAFGAFTRTTILHTILDAEGARVFASIEEVEELTTEDIERLIQDSAKALEVPKESPLAPVPTPESEKPSS